MKKHPRNINPLILARWILALKSAQTKKSQIILTNKIMALVA